MDVILLERVAKLGQMGETVNVKDGYARNFLLPKGKALRANKANMEYFESQRAALEKKNADRMAEAETVKGRMDGTTYVAVRSAGETGQLYGSVAARDVADLLVEAGFKVGRGQVELQSPIKMIGLHEIAINLHPDVQSTITVNVARSADEAQRQADGEDLTRRDAFDDDETGEEPDLEEVFENPADVELEGLVGNDEETGTPEGESGAVADADAAEVDADASEVDERV